MSVLRTLQLFFSLNSLKVEGLSLDTTFFCIKSYHHIVTVIIFIVKEYRQALILQGMLLCFWLQMIAESLCQNKIILCP